MRAIGEDGLHINDVAVTTPWAKMAAVSGEWGIRSSDSMLVAQSVELKVTNEHIALTKFMRSHGIVAANLMTPIWGGYGGPSPGTAIITVAEHILPSLWRTKTLSKPDTYDKLQQYRKRDIMGREHRRPSPLKKLQDHIAS